MATPASQFTTRDAFNQQVQKSVSDTTDRLRQYSVQTALAAKETVAFADATGRGRITMENFGRTFDNATRKVIVWQFAILAVYGALRKVSDTIQIWRDFEVTLERISITTGAVGDRLQAYFKQVADVAIEFGVSIDQALTGMDLALRATAQFSGEAKRTTVAVQLLRDASVLANITGMQYSQSIDILVGSLRQSGLQLDQGVKLLDKWVAVAKNAAVSVNDLSQGFAIMADAGRAAGLTVDQINGLIAALSETVTLGPVEVGNAIRALMSTLYNESSINLMQKFGVAVRDTQGEVRSFWEVMQQLSSMRTAGVLDESVWLEIAKAAGAGQRRYAQFLALLNNFSTAMRVAGISSNAEGQAMEANQKIVDTLTNSFDKFTAAQRKFLYVLGDQTGAIEDLSGALLKLTNFFDTLSNAGDGVWKLGRAVMFLVGTLGALKVASLAMGWLGVGPKVGSMLGRFAGIPAARVAGSTAAARAVTTMGITTPEAAMAAGIGTIAPGVAGRAGLLGLSGLLPGFLRNRIMGSATGGATFNTATNRWMGYGASGRYGFVPSPMIGGQPFNPMTWGGVRARIQAPMRGLGAGVGALGAGALAYGLTGEPASAAGAAIGAGVGAWFGGPLGMAVGGAFGTFIGHTIADAFVSEEDRIRSMFEKVSEDFGYSAEKMLSAYYDIAKQTTAGAREIAAEAAPELPEIRAAEGKSFLEKLFVPSVAKYASPLLIGNAPGEEEWTKGTGALNELNRALIDGVITLEEYRRAKQDDYIAWNELTDAAKAYMTAIRIGGVGTEGQIEVAKAYAQAVSEQAEKERALATISNRYSDSQARIRDIMNEVGTAIDGINLKDWEQSHIQALLQQQIKMTSDEFQAWYDVLLGASYGYASHLEAVERLAPALQEYGIAINAIPEDKWLLIQRWDTTLATRIVETAQTLADLTNSIDTFKVEFPDILKLSGIQGTIEDIDAVREAIALLHEQTAGEEYADALTKIDQYMADVLQQAIEARRFGTLSQAGTQFQRPTEVRLTDQETIKAYTEQLGKLPALTQLAQSLGKFDTTVLTLVDPITGQTLRMEENTLALQMLGQVVEENTKEVQRLEAEYNLPGWYQRPNRFWAMQQTGGGGGFGPAQEGLWTDWISYLQQNRSYATGGTVPETGPYYLHKKETVVSADNLASTNTILGNSYRVLVISQQYLSSISLGISGLRQEIQSLREFFATKDTDSSSTNFAVTTRTGGVATSSLGVKRR
jgi:TP901 family phage tail tape measure protein